MLRRTLVLFGTLFSIAPVSVLNILFKLMKKGHLNIFLLFLLSSCAVGKQQAAKKYSKTQLQNEYTLFQNIIEETHPGVYWYMPKDSMDAYFEKGKSMLKDSMTEPQYRTVLSYVISKLGCGHTTVRPSKSYLRSSDTLRNRQFPILFKLWKDTALVTFYAGQRDSGLSKGAVVTAIDGMPMQHIVDSLFQFISTDGYNLTHKYQTLSNGGVFGALYLNVFGYKPTFTISYINAAGAKKSTTIPIYIRDTSANKLAQNRPEPKKIPRRQRKRQQIISARSLRFDTAQSTAFMELNTFQKSGKLRRFFRHSFKGINTLGVTNLVVDLRANGGGNVTNSILLTKYIAKNPFKIADSLYTRHKKPPYAKYQQNHFANTLFALFMTRRQRNGAYHFGYYERKKFKPKKRYHFDGNVYVLSGGNTFSASTLFISSVNSQNNVTVVGEETGGGAYGNNAWLIPDVTLPITKVRFRLPLYRLVIDKSAQKGYGVPPHIVALPTTNAIINNHDFKKDKALELIKARKQ